MTLADELLMIPGKLVDRFSTRVVTCGSVRLPFDGTLSAEEQRMLEQFAFADPEDLR